jgi:hypothetical protein
MLNTLLAVVVSVVGFYTMGTLANVSYRLMRISELKIDHDNTRNKDAKNECVNLTRHHMQGIKESWKWPSIVVASILAAVRWGRSLETK